MAEKTKTSRGSALWQIYIPAAAAAVILIMAGALVVLDQSPGNTSRFAELSTALLVIPVMLIALVFLAVSGLSIYLVQRLIKGVPPVAGRVLAVVDRIQLAGKDLSRMIVKPVIRPRAFLSGVKGIFNRKSNGIKLED